MRSSFNYHDRQNHYHDRLPLPDKKEPSNPPWHTKKKTTKQKKKKQKNQKTHQMDTFILVNYFLVY